MSTAIKEARQDTSKTTSHPGVSRAPHAPARTRSRAVRPALALNDTERSQLCIESIVSLTTIGRWAAGLPVERTTQLRLERAMAKLGIERREKPKDRRRRAA